MTPYSFERIEMPEIGVLRYNITGLETNAQTEPGLVQICKRLEIERHWTGVLFDHSQSQISYTLTEFNERLEYAIKHFPRRVRLAYVFNAQTFVVSARATKVLNTSGIEARAFPNAEDALEFLKQAPEQSAEAV
ncbi:hypothetical protein [Oceanicaulis sp. MMSF_3324]|uniref:hypothetical protein n=1 Tax=Oceanicaulis sp. MMSF_3324 TaxID=3046702 RepID=UPI00273FCD73|nr:hypothetical protein [Oceanicaulis sp. MMSF_3324]